jgi:hypothetical protein
MHLYKHYQQVKITLEMTDNKNKEFSSDASLLMKEMEFIPMLIFL